jgi:hypothetical protein
MNVNTAADSLFNIITLDFINTASSVELRTAIDKINRLFLTSERAARLDAMHGLIGLRLSQMAQNGRLSPSPAAGGRTKKSRSRR